MSNRDAMQVEKGAELIVGSGLKKSYWAGKRELPVVKGVDISLRKGEVLMICGPSGVGKSTLLHMLGLLDPPTSGDVVYRGENLTSSSPGRQAAVRNRSIGFVFQFYHLLPDLDVVENTVLPLMVKNSVFSWFSAKRGHREKARRILASMGLGERLTHRPSQLSGGERQRVAIARALVSEPEILFCDEPTGNLDTKTSGEILEVLWKVKEEFDQTFAIVTHNINLAKQGSRHLNMIDGKIYKPEEMEHAQEKS